MRYYEYSAQPAITTKNTDIYKPYAKNYVNPVKRAVYIAVTQEFNRLIMHEIINNAFEYILPYQLGSIAIKKRKLKMRFNPDGSLVTRKLNCNYAETNKLWASNPDAKAKKIMVWHTNDHTDNWSYWVNWDRGRSTNGTKNIHLYQFKPSQAYGSRALAKALFSGINVEYYTEPIRNDW